MINKLAVMVVLVGINVACAPTMSEMTDSRDGKTYQAVEIGGQVWMAANLNFEMPGAYAYDNEAENAVSDGLLYSWDNAIEACPAGWHLPSDEEWGALLSELGDDAGAALKSTTGWVEDGNGTNSSGFNAPATGWGASDTVFYARGEESSFWSSTEHNERQAMGRMLQFTNPGVYQSDFPKTNAYSCRCVQD